MNMPVLDIARTKKPKKQRMKQALQNYYTIIKEQNNRSFFEFFKYFWPQVSDDALSLNWHIEYLCDELQKVAENVALGLPKEYDLVINIPPGTTKTTICSIMFPAWCWTRWHWMRFITSSYSGALSLESAEYCRDLIKSDQFMEVYPELTIKDDKDTKSNFRLQKSIWDNIKRMPAILRGGNRYSTSVGGTLTGFHGHMLIVDDPLNPKQAVSEKELDNVNHWMEQTLSTRKVSKRNTPLILIMQRLHQNDPSGKLLAKKKKKVKHISLPGQIRDYEKQLKPIEVKEKYKDGLLDPKRMSWEELDEMEIDLGQYGYAGQVGQNPVPPGGGMFKVDRFSYIEAMPSQPQIMGVVRYWDKAGSQGAGCYTVGVKMARLRSGKFIVMDVKRGQWSSEVREAIIKDTAEADGRDTLVYHEQEPGSGGKESAEATTKNLAGFVVQADLPRGDKVYRADPYSVQVNNGNVQILKGEWNLTFIEEHRFFPFSTYKDQVDGASGAFTKLVGKKEAKIW